MMDSVFFIVKVVGLVGIVSSIGYLFRSWNRRASLASLKEKNDCAEPARWPQTDSWGADLIAARSAAMRQGKFFDLYRTQFREIGHRTWTDRVRGETTINTIDPVLTKYILSDDESFGKYQGQSSTLSPFLGESVLTEGPHHKLIKSLLRPAFSRAESSDSYRIRPFAEQFFQLLPAPGVVFDIQPLLHRLYLDVATDFLFGQSIDSMGAGEAEAKEFLAAFQKGLKFVRLRTEAGFLAFKYNWDKEYKDAYTTIHKFVDKQVQKALANVDKEPESILEVLAKDIKDPIQLRYQILGIFIPARDAGSIAMGNVLFELARHPEIWTRLRQIALTVKEPSAEELRSSKFADFRDVIHETFRHVGGARGVRIAKKDTIVPVGGGKDEAQPILVPKGTKVAIFNKVLNLDPNHWGADAHLFKPERWKEREGGFHWDFRPFGAGSRTCPAIAQSTTHLTYLMVKLLQRYETIENHDPDFEWSEKWTLTIESRNGVKIAFR